MRTKITFSTISFVMLLIASLSFSTSVFAQQALENSITKDIPLTHPHIDGDGVLTLDLSKDLGLTADKVVEFVNALSVSAGETGTLEVATKGGTIALLKPANSSIHPKALVLREIKTELVAEVAGVDGKDEEFIFRLTPQPFPDESIIQIKKVVLIKLYNTTKSRINLQDWQIRFTSGVNPDATTERVIDTMSNVDEKTWAHGKQHDAQNIFSVKSLIMSRQIDFKLLTDPMKTKDEQLSAISDGTLQTGWNINMKPVKPEPVGNGLPQWIEIYNRKDGATTIRVEMRETDEPVVPPENPEVIIDPAPPTEDF
ncbi:MAG: hypothetical protein OXH39_23890 [Candidatus Poribacteria bacterium]|nr:hypothetical protein [Candidatus Poribacteria bacterium]